MKKKTEKTTQGLLWGTAVSLLLGVPLVAQAGGGYDDSRYDRAGDERFYTDEYGDVDTMWEERNYRGDFDFRSGDDRWNRDYPASERYRSRGHYRDPESYWDAQPYVSPDTYREDYRETGYRRDERFRDFRDSRRSDVNLRENIRQELKESPYLDANRIEVQARNGVVTLMGTVENRDALVTAEENAYEGGARKVVNNLRIQRAEDRPWTNMGDNELRKEIESELTWSPFVDADKIHVRVREGVAILQGDVQDRSEMAAAVENAYEAGARRVVNQMRSMRN
jgi:osmotically-inducible protein OsmY